MSKPLAFLDLDGVVYDVVGAICRVLQERWLLPVFPEDVTDYNMTHLARYAAPGRQQEVAGEIIALFSDPKFYHGLKVIPGSQEAVMLLCRHYDLWALTGRPIKNGVAKVTRERVMADFPWLEGRSVGGERQAKVRFCDPKQKHRLAREYRAARVFEDNPKTANRVARNGVSVTLIRTPYMGFVGGPRIHIVDSLLEAAKDITNRPNPLDALLRNRLEGALG